MSTRLSYEGQGTTFIGSASITVAALTTGTQADYSITDANCAVGDVIAASPSNAMAEAHLGVVAAWVSAAGTIKVRIANLGAGTLTGGANTVNYTVSRS